MKKRFVTTPVKGGWVKRDARTGRFVEVGTAKSTYRANATTQSALQRTSSKRNAALKRLADR